MRLPFTLLDVFTDTPFGGNQLAVVRLETPLPDTLMQRIAAEFNLSETVFVLPDDGDADWRLRIFTPRIELPFAGHPTIGAAILLGGGRRAVLRLRENVGVVPVEVEGNRATLSAVAAPESRPSPLTREQAAPVVGLSALEIAADPVGVSAGLPFLMLEVTGESALRRAVCDAALWRERVAAQWAHHLFLFYETGPGEVAARMFAPAMGIVEDPATGAAAAALGAHVALRATAPDLTGRFLIRQGASQGRPSELTVSFERRGGRVTAIRVGGAAVVMAGGTLELPAS